MSSVSNRNFSRCLQRLKRSYKQHKAKPLPAVFKTRLDGSSVSWKIFRRLNLATVFADSCTKDCMVFSFEERLPDSAGQRLFLVTHPEHLWLNYKSRAPEQRCSYEVIRDGFPCKLYFDLEFQHCYNEGKIGNEMTKIFIECIKAAMLDQYNIKFETSDVLWLDASTNQKFSCHLILQLKDLAFENNIQAGFFVSSLILRVKDKIESNAEEEGLWPSGAQLKNLLVRTSNDRENFFCDTGVYTKNRNFRLYLSTKLGKNAPLFLSKCNEYTSTCNGKCKSMDEAIFYDSLITYFRGNDRNLRLLTNKAEHIAKSQSKSILSQNQEKKQGVSGCTKSPFPDLDDFISSIIRDNYAIGFIRKWTFLSKKQIIIYEIGNYRFCGNIGRHHKSNNIRIIVNLKERFFYQMCHDPECRLQGYRSEAMNIPESVMSVSIPEDFFNYDCFSQLNDSPNVTDDHNEREHIIKEMNPGNDKDNINDIYFEEMIENDGCFSQFSDCYNERHELHIKKSDIVMVKTFEAEKNNLDDKFLDCFFNDLDSETSKDLAECERISNSISLCENISTEEEMVMAEAAAAVELVADGYMFSEETLF